MSIINDALKKTQSKLISKISSPSDDGKRAETPTPPPAAPAVAQIPAAQDHVSAQKFMAHAIQTKKKNQERLLIAASIFICILLLAAMVVGFSKISSSGLTRKPKHTNTDGSNFAINGIFKQDNKITALINNEIYEVGDSINGMEIVAITMDRVDVTENGQVKSLKVNKK